MLIEFNIILNSDRASMKETTPARTSHGGELNSPPVSLAMPPCFDRWCKKFDDLLRTKAQKRECGMHRAASRAGFKIPLPHGLDII